MGSRRDARRFGGVSLADWRDTAAAEGIALTYRAVPRSFGKKNDLILRGWLGTDANAERIQRVGDAKEAEYRRLARDEGLEPLPGAAEWVARLHAAGWKQAIASSAPRANVEVVMAALGFEPLIDAIVAAEDVTHSKPAPDVFLEAARRLGVPVRAQHRRRGCGVGHRRREGRRHEVDRRQPAYQAD